jgi:hypothetical protein
LFTLGLSDADYANNYITNLVEKSKKLQKQMEKNPSYMKKKYKDDFEGDDDYLSSLGL